MTTGMKVGAQVVDMLLLGAGGRRRELQDSPVLGDVWARFADIPGIAHDLLITPTWEKPTGMVAGLVAGAGSTPGDDPSSQRNVSYIQDLVVASLTLDDLAGVAIPLTKWWDEIEDQWEAPSDERLRKLIEGELDDALQDERPDGRLTAGNAQRRAEMSTQDRQVAKLGLMLGVLRAAAVRIVEEMGSGPEPPSTIAAAEEILGRDTILDKGVEGVRLIRGGYRDLSGNEQVGVIFQVSLTGRVAGDRRIGRRHQGRRRPLAFFHHLQGHQLGDP